MLTYNKEGLERLIRETKDSIMDLKLKHRGIELRLGHDIKKPKAIDNLEDTIKDFEQELRELETVEVVSSGYD